MPGPKQSRSVVAFLGQLPCWLPLSLGCTVWFATTLPARTATSATVEIVISDEAPEVEKFAAGELTDQLVRLFAADVSLVPPGDTSAADYRILLGSPQTNPELEKWRTDWPELSEQGHLLREIPEQGVATLIVGGNTPVATLWAVYELGHHWGVRYFLFGDLDPVDPRPLSFRELHRVIDPMPAQRGWTLWDDAPTGMQGWGLAAQQELIGQLAKLKFTHVALRPRPWQPFVDFEFHETPKRSAHLWDGTEFIVAGDTGGRTAFRGAQRFDNPDLADKSKYKDRVAAGRTLLSGVIAAAHQHGLQTTLTLSPGVFAQEFAAAISPPLVPTATGPGRVPSADSNPRDPNLAELAYRHLEAFRTTFPESDRFELSVADLRDWPISLEQAVEGVYSRLTGDERNAWDLVLEEARRRADPDELDDWRTFALGLTLIHSMADISRKESRKEPTKGDDDGRPAVPASLEIARLPLADVPARLLPPLRKLGFPVAEWHFELDFGNIPRETTAESESSSPQTTSTVDAATSGGTVDLPLAATRPSVLPELDSQQLHRRLDQMHHAGFSSYRIRSWELGDLDLAAYWLSRLASGEKLSAEQACHHLLEPVCGEEVAERVITAFEEIAAASRMIAAHDLDLGRPRTEMLLRYYHGQPSDLERWSRIRDHYLNAMNEMYRANTRARQGGRIYTLYFARRFEFAFEYMNCLLALREAGAADEDEELRLTELEKGIESLYGGLNALSAVARSPSDLGIIAVLNAYGYHRLMRALDE